MSNQASLGDISGSRSSSDSGDMENQEWKEEKLGDLAFYQNGNSFSKSQWSEEGYPIIRIQNLTGEQEEYNHFDGDLDEKYRVENGDILLAWSGTIDLFQWEGEDAALNQHIYRVDTEDGINNIFFQFKLEEVIPRLIALSHGSTMKHVRKADLVNLDVEIPSDIDEQRRIASVLYNVDQAISKTEEIIEQTQRVKKGLMQDLFREYGEETSEHILLGEYPADWELHELSEICDIHDAEHFTADYVDEGIPVLRPGDLSPGRISLESVEKRVDKETYKELIRRYEPSKKDIVYSRSQNFAVASIVDEEEKFCLGQDMVVIEPNEVNRDFLMSLLNSPAVRQQADRMSTGSTFDRVNLGDIKSYEVPIPDQETQEKISRVLKSAEERIRAYKKEKEQLQRLKKGLMQDLLTGSVRTGEDVEVLDEVVEVEG